MNRGSLEAEVRRLSDLEAIRDLARRYAHCVWTRDVRGAAELFTVDGCMDTGTQPPIRGREAIFASYQNLLGPAVFEPFVHNHVIRLEGERATGTCYLDLRATMDGRSLIGSGYYDDDYAHEDGCWRFRSRRLTMRYLVPVAPGWAAPAAPAAAAEPSR